MAERLNFYDIYGYLLPGFALIAFVCLPFGISDAKWPPLSWASAIIAVALAYLAGHVVQMLTQPALPGTPLHYDLLEDSDQSFSLAFKKALRTKILESFTLNVDSSPDEDLEEVKRRRRDAFLMCRARLLQQRGGAYSEQFQGMEALMRGLVGASILGAAFQAGWIAAAIVKIPKVALTGVLMPVGLLTVVHLWFSLVPGKKGTGKDPALLRPLWLLSGVAVTLVLAGLAVGAPVADAAVPTKLAAMMIGTVLLSVRSHAAYLSFRKNFATTVYRDFAALKAVAQGNVSETQP